jgi:hypothetical protein
VHYLTKCVKKPWKALDKVLGCNKMSSQIYICIYNLSEQYNINIDSTFDVAQMPC